MKLLNFATFLTVISASAYAKTGLDDSALAAPKDFADVVSSIKFYHREHSRMGSFDVS